MRLPFPNRLNLVEGSFYFTLKQSHPIQFYGLGSLPSLFCHALPSLASLPKIEIFICMREMLAITIQRNGEYASSS